MVAKALERRRNSGGPPRHRVLYFLRPHVSIRSEHAPGRGGHLDGSSLLLGEYSSRAFVDRQTADTTGLGGADLETSDHVRDRASDGQRLTVQVHITPPKATKLAAPTACRCGHEQEGRKLRIMIESKTDEVLYLLRSRSRDLLV